MIILIQLLNKKSTKLLAFFFAALFSPLILLANSTLEDIKVSNLTVEENQEITAGSVLCQWDPHAIPILAEVSGKVRFEDVVEGETMRLEKDPSGTFAS